MSQPAAPSTPPMPADSASFAAAERARSTRLAARVRTRPERAREAAPSTRAAPIRAIPRRSPPFAVGAAGGRNGAPIASQLPRACIRRSARTRARRARPAAATARAERRPATAPLLAPHPPIREAGVDAGPGLRLQKSKTRVYKPTSSSLAFLRRMTD